MGLQSSVTLAGLMPAIPLVAIPSEGGWVGDWVIVGFAVLLAIGGFLVMFNGVLSQVRDK